MSAENSYVEDQMAETLEAGCGQIKIDLSANVRYTILGDRYFDHRGREQRIVRNLKYPGLSQIIRTLEKTGAAVLRMTTEGRFTVIDYTTI